MDEQLLKALVAGGDAQVNLTHWQPGQRELLQYSQSGSTGPAAGSPLSKGNGLSSVL